MPCENPAVIVQFSSLMSVTMALSRPVEQFGITNETPFPLRGGAASATPCCPASMRYRRPYWPRNEPLLREKPCRGDLAAGSEASIAM